MAKKIVAKETVVDPMFRDYQIFILIQTIKLLRARGFDSVWIEISPDFKKSSYGISRIDPKKKPKKYLFGLIKKPLSTFLGVIWFGNEECGANWHRLVFDVYGNDNYEILKYFGEELIGKLGVDIILQLISKITLEQIPRSSQELPTGTLPISAETTDKSILTAAYERTLFII